MTRADDGDGQMDLGTGGRKSEETGRGSNRHEGGRRRTLLREIVDEWTIDPWMDACIRTPVNIVCIYINVGG
jgi:hypothetical protein